MMNTKKLYKCSRSNSRQLYKLPDRKLPVKYRDTMVKIMMKFSSLKEDIQNFKDATGNVDAGQSLPNVSDLFKLLDLMK